ncbi:DNA alkylation repair protein [Lactococcus fujiensis]|uniref:DNA alkylation repair protein n=1 Tax=Lactococcus fujiensis JCM 16395 TaxID=1291764 RepID=A0A2A5RMM3_9LACT|nr:DNA alkylation repair protein [Lactococcus fujiensis]PCS00585.1 DNA alkylation repair protein [Lactococcus fujiensis JCM 16395]
MDIIEQFYAAADAINAVSQKAYLRNQFEFLGIKTPIRRAISKAFINELASTKEIDWELVDKLWELPEREFQYLATDILRKMKNSLEVQDFEKIKDLALRKSWWDTVDSLDELIGAVIQREVKANSKSPHELTPSQKMSIKWAKNENFWVRRIAIDCQLGFKDKTNTRLLSSVIKANLAGSKFADEFFINKSIGWALRDYSKSNPEWVREFLMENEKEMSKLSIREAAKYI